LANQADAVGSYPLYERCGIENERCGTSVVAGAGARQNDLALKQTLYLSVTPERE
jgi:hypothetical protein